MNVLVAGGAGYIGSHAVRQLVEAGHRVVALDNLHRGHRGAVDPRAVFHQLDLVSGTEIPVVYGPRRAGDPAVLYANADKIRRELGWSARYTEIEPIIATAWKWFQKHPGGYESEQ